MKAFGKYWLFLLMLCVGSVVFIKCVYSGDMLVEHSLAYQKNLAPQKSLSKLFSALGVTPLSQMVPESGGDIIMNPCFDLEEYTRKYCTPHSMQLLLSEHIFIEMEDQLLRKMLLHDDGCEQIAQYIGRVCYQENFKKIFKHFALEK